MDLLDSELQNFEVSIHILHDASLQQKYSRDFHSYYKRFQAIKNSAEKISKSAEKSQPTIENLMLNRGRVSKEREIVQLINSVQIYNTSSADLLRIGDHFINRALEETKGIHKELDLNNQRADQVNLGLLEQNERLAAVDDEMGEIKLLADQGKKRITKMMVNFYKDRSILVLCIIVLILSIVLIGLKMSRVIKVNDDTAKV